MKRIIFFILACLSVLPAFSQTQQNKLLFTDDALFQHFFMSGLNFRLKGEYKQAYESFMACRRIRPQSSVINYELSQIANAAGDAESAAKFANESVENDSSSNPYYIKNAILCNLKASDVQRSLSLFDLLIKREPSNVQYYVGKAQIQMDAKLFSDAIRTIDSYKVNDKQNLERLSVLKSDVYVLMGKTRKSEKILKKLVKDNPQTPIYHYLLSKFYFENNQLNKSLDYCKKATQLKNGDEYLFSLASIYRSLRMDSLFVDTNLEGFASKELSEQSKLKRLYEFMSDPSAIATDKSYSYFFERIFLLCQSQYPDSKEFCALKEGYYSQNNMPQHAKKVIANFLDSNEGDEYLWQRYLFNYSDGLSDKEMIVLSQRAMADVPDNVIFPIIYAQYLQLDKQYDKSIQTYKNSYSRILSEKFSNAEQLKKQVLHGLADCYFKVDSLKQSFAIYDQLIESDPNDVLALNNYAYFLALNDMDLDHAEKMSRKAIEINPRNSSYLDTYAFVLFKKANYQEALFIQERCLENLNADSEEVYEHYGDILFMNGQKDKAITMWQKAYSINNQSVTLKRKIDEGKYIK